MNKSLLFVAAATLAAAVQAQAPKLTTQKFPDGSGQIGVAPGWKLDDGGAGAAILSGPGGAMMQLGQFRFVFAHNFDQQTLTPGVNPEVPRVHLDDPVRAMIEATALLQKAGLVTKLKLKGVEPAPWFQLGRSALIRYSFHYQGKPFEAFGLFTVVATDAQSGSYFYSVVMASPETYAKRLPEMKAMWSSWSVSQKLLQGRLDKAAKIIGEIDVPSHLDDFQQKQRLEALKSARKFQALIRDDPK